MSASKLCIDWGNSFVKIALFDQNDKITDRYVVNAEEVIDQLHKEILPRRIFSGAIPLIKARDLFPNAAGQPRLSTLTIATLTPPFSKTSALTKRSPFFWVDGLGVPIPPETGSKGLGVMTRTAAPALKLFCAKPVKTSGKIK